MEDIRNMKVGDFLDLLTTLINNKQENDTEKKYLSKNEVLEQYPLFTESSLSKAVKFQGLEYIKSGRCRYYAKDSIEKWLENQKQKEIYNRFEGIKF
ncbi:MAG: hypothetical protein E7164_01180 [Firmicutes bacterium]|nr:hypothetical protein [Bacillota bacterium]